MPVEWDVTGLVPENITPQQAAAFGIPFASAVRLFWVIFIMRFALIQAPIKIQFLYFRLKIPEYPAQANGEWILIWSGVSPSLLNTESIYRDTKPPSPYRLQPLASTRFR